MNAKPRITIVYNERTIASSLTMAFEMEGFRVRTFGDGWAALDAFGESMDDIAILGRSLPRMDGPELFRRLRTFSAIPVIFLSSHGEELADTAPGADDYLGTPFSLRLVVDRAKTVLRRHRAERRSGGWAAGIEGKMFAFDPGRRTCHWGNERLYLNMPELIILEALTVSGVHTHLALMAAIYGDAVEMDQHTIDAHVCSLRRRIRLVDPTFDAIELVCGVAYRLKRV